MVQTAQITPLAVQIQQIDHVTEHFYRYRGFDAEHYPNADALEELFFGDGHLVDHSYAMPMEFTLSSFLQAQMKQIDAGNADFYVQQEIADKTQVFGHIAQRLSVYEYSTTKDASVKWKKGINLIQFIFNNGRWRISAMIWQDESENFAIPEDLLS